jgi:hypothetical protein
MSWLRAVWHWYAAEGTSNGTVVYPDATLYAQLAGEWLRKLQLVPPGGSLPRFGEQYGAWNALPDQPGCYISGRSARTLYEDDETRRLIERVNVRVQKFKLSAT